MPESNPGWEILAAGGRATRSSSRLRDRTIAHGSTWLGIFTATRLELWSATPCSTPIRSSTKPPSRIQRYLPGRGRSACRSIATKTWTAFWNTNVRPRPKRPAARSSASHEHGIPSHERIFHAEDYNDEYTRVPRPAHAGNALDSLGHRTSTGPTAGPTAAGQSGAGGSALADSTNAGRQAGSIGFLHIGRRRGQLWSRTQTAGFSHAGKPGRRGGSTGRQASVSRLGKSRTH